MTKTKTPYLWLNKLTLDPLRNSHRAPRLHTISCYKYIEPAYRAPKLGCVPLQTFLHPSQSPLAAESSRRATRHALKSPSTSRLLTYFYSQMHQNPNEGRMETYQTPRPIHCEPSSELPDCVQASTRPSL